jgi:hypothetical protein
LIAVPTFGAVRHPGPKLGHPNLELTELTELTGSDFQIFQKNILERA